MEAALRTAADVLSGRDLDSIRYEAVRGLVGIKKATARLGPKGEVELKVAVCHQTKTVREFLSQIEAGDDDYHFIEVMTWYVCTVVIILPFVFDAIVLT